jgi:hypothetical protein
MTNCIICSIAHNEIFEDNIPSRYCAPCAILKKESVLVISHIIDNLYLSGLDAAKLYANNITRLYVHEEPMDVYGGETIHVPILEKKPNSTIDRNGALVSLERLNQTFNIIDDYVLSNEPLLIHCHGGVERSPLVLAWYLTASDKFKTLSSAYEFLKSKRSVVSNRIYWLPQFLIDKYG